jgi:hypothetical protein
MKGESDTKEPEDAGGDQVATDVTSKGRRQRNVPMGDEGQWKVVSTRSVRPLNPSEIHSEMEIQNEGSL